MESNEQQPKPIPSGLIPFEKGKSGNPGGRPKSSLLANACREKLEEIDPKTGLTGAKTLADALYREACRGNVVGWAPSTMVQMAARYGHFTLDELRGAVETINKQPGRVTPLMNQKMNMTV